MRGGGEGVKREVEAIKEEERRGERGEGGGTGI